MYSVTITSSKYLKTPNSKSFHFNISTWKSQPGVFLVYSNSSDFLSQHNVHKSDRNLHVNLQPLSSCMSWWGMSHKIAIPLRLHKLHNFLWRRKEADRADGDAAWLNLSLTPPKHCYSYTYVLATCQSCRWISEDIPEGLSPAPL